MFSMLSKKTTAWLTLMMLAFASYFAIHGQQARPVALSNEANNQAKTAANAKGVSVHPVAKANHPRLSQPLSPPQVVAEHKLSPQDWLAAFQDAYPADDKTVSKLLDSINAELRPDFIEQLLRQVQFLADGDAVRETIENTLTMKLANLDPPRAADYVIAALAQQKQPANLDPAQSNANPDFALQQLKMPGQQFMLGHRLISSLMQSWGEKDLPQAIAWALALEDEQTKTQALNMLSYTRDEHKIDQIADEVNRLTDSNVRSGLLTQLAEQKAQIDPNAAVSWVSSWPDSPERNQAISALIGNRTSQSLEDTASLTEQALAAGMDPDETATDMLINQWHYKAPKEAYQWANNLPDSAVKTRALLLLDAFKAEAESK